MADAMRRGVRIGVDVGTVRVGVARSDPDGMLALPVETVPRGRDDEALTVRLLGIAAEYDAVEVVVGLPVSMRGTDTASTADARRVAALLAAATPLPVRLVDERLTTVSAAASLRSAGRSARSSRAVIDQQAAVILLQHALDAERVRGAAPGLLAQPSGGTA